MNELIVWNDDGCEDCEGGCCGGGGCCKGKTSVYREGKQRGLIGKKFFYNHI